MFQKIDTLLHVCLAAAGLWLGFASSAMAADPLLVVEDNDFNGPGSSDIQSVVPLIGNPAVRVLGFTVVTGDGWCAEETNDLLRFLEVAKRTDIPVVQGAVFPLVNSRDRMKAWEQSYGKVVWKGAWNDSAPGQPRHPADPSMIPPHPEGNPTTKPAPGSAAQFLIDQVHRYPHQVTILAAGPMTNLALAIRLDPDFASLAKELVFMGALIGTNLQQVTDDADFATDFNIIFDPEAAHIVFTAGWAKIIAVGNPTNETTMTPELTARMAAKKTPVTAFLAKYVEKLPLWDEMAAAIAVDHSLITQSVDAYMDVDLDHGMNYGVVHVWPDSTTPHLGERKVTIVRSVDVKRFVDGFVIAAQFPVPEK